MQATFNTATTTIQAAYNTAQKAAQDVVEGTQHAAADPREAASASARSDQVVAGISGLVEAELQLEAGVALARTADEMTGSLLDILA